jgi:hypothetical protein
MHVRKSDNETLARLAAHNFLAALCAGYIMAVHGSIGSTHHQLAPPRADIRWWACRLPQSQDGSAQRSGGSTSGVPGPAVTFRHS